MQRTDFINYEIANFPPEEIIDSGAKLEDVCSETIICLQRLRSKLMTPINILKNGLTSGGHKSQEHKNGKAVDVYIKKFKNTNSVIYIALECGFRGIGVYYNRETKTYTFHFDLGKTRFWGAFKNRTKENWTYFQILKDPKIYGKPR